MAYKVLKAVLGFEKNEGNNPNFDYSFDTFESTITNEFKNYLNVKKAITINTSQSSFGYDVHNLASSVIATIKNNAVYDPKIHQLKLIIQMLDDEENKVSVFVFIRDTKGKGWVIYDQSGFKIDSSKEPQQQILITENGYHVISSGQDLASIAKFLAKRLKLDPIDSMALVTMATKTGVGISELTAKAVELAKNNAPFGIMSDTMEFDRGVEFGPSTQQLQRCLIRFAGGNLESERKHLSGANYPIDTTRWPAGHGPIFANRKADNGRYDKETVSVLKQLKPYIDQIKKGFINDDAYAVKDDILTSPICQGLISDVTDLERKNLKSKTPMGIPSMVTQQPPEVVDVPKPAPTTPTAPTAPPAPIKTDSQLKIENLKKTYKNMYTYQDMIKIISDEERTYFARTGNLKTRLQKIDTKVIEWLTKVNTKNKNIIFKEIKDYSKTLEKEYTVGVTSKFNKKAISFLYDLISRIDTLTVESKVYKEYGFLSTKNEKLHSVLMEQLKKDLKRG